MSVIMFCILLWVIGDWMQASGRDWEEAEETKEESSEEKETSEDSELLDFLPLSGLADKAEINNLCAKYKITFNKWLKLATEVMATGEMMIA